jgi:hypothetical protein
MARPVLGQVDPVNRGGVVRARRQPVDGVRGDDDDAATAEGVGDGRERAGVVEVNGTHGGLERGGLRA